MSEFEDKLNAILSSPEAMGQIAALAGSLNLGGESSPSEAPAPEAPANGGESAPEPAKAPSGAGIGDLLRDFDPGMLAKLMPLVREYQSGQDEKTALLHSLEPFLKPESRDKVEKAIRITRLSRVIRASMTLFRENGHV